MRLLISDSLGLPDIAAFWRWQNCPPKQAEQRLESLLKLRHEITHGVNPRPVVSRHYAGQLPAFITNLGECTDAAVREHLVATLGVEDPWPV